MRSRAPFPDLTRSDDALAGRDQIANLRGGKTTFGVRVLVEEGAVPSLAQHRAHELFKDDALTLLDVVNQAVFTHYCDMRPTYRDPRWPKVSKPEQLISKYELSTVHVHGLEKGGVAYLGFEFSCAWDGEHGLGVLVHKSRVIEVGGSDVAFSLALESQVSPRKPAPPPAWLVKLRARATVMDPSAANDLFVELESLFAKLPRQTSQQGRLVMALDRVISDPFGSAPAKARLAWRTILEVMSNPAMKQLRASTMQSLRDGIEASVAALHTPASIDEIPDEAPEDQMDVFVEILTGCVAEWCMKNPNFVDAKGRPTRVGKHESLRHLLPD